MESTLSASDTDSDMMKAMNVLYKVIKNSSNDKFISFYITLMYKEKLIRFHLTFTKINNHQTLHASISESWDMNYLDVNKSKIWRSALDAT